MHRPHQLEHGQATDAPTPMTRRGIAGVSAVMLIVTLFAAAPGRAGTLYDATLGTLPTAQGWTLHEDMNPIMTYPVSLGPEGLHLSTLGFGSNVPANVGGAAYWSRDEFSIDFSDDFIVEASVRIVEAPNHSINTQDGWPRPGCELSVIDANGHAFWIGFGSAHVFLSNNFYGQYGSGNTVDIAFNTTDQHHVYRLQRAPGGVGAALLIDGVPTLELPELGPVYGGPLLYFGDGTYWANGASHTAWVRAFESTTGVSEEPRKRAGVLHARPLRSPARHLAVAFGSEAAGSLTFEAFDVVGRRVESSQRQVSSGGSGTFTAAAKRDGVYFYRVRLIPADGAPAVTTTGKIVVAH